MPEPAIPCPHCGYAIPPGTHSRCPECGRTTDTPELALLHARVVSVCLRLLAAALLLMAAATMAEPLLQRMPSDDLGSSPVESLSRILPNALILAALVPLALIGRVRRPLILIAVTVLWLLLLAFHVARNDAFVWPRANIYDTQPWYLWRSRAGLAIAALPPVLLLALQWRLVRDGLLGAAGGLRRRLGALVLGAGLAAFAAFVAELGVGELDSRFDAALGARVQRTQQESDLLALRAAQVRVTRAWVGHAASVSVPAQQLGLALMLLLLAPIPRPPKPAT